MSKGEIKTVTKAEAISLLRRARREVGGDYIDPLASGGECRYYYDAKAWEIDPNDVRVPRCVVGQVLHYLGVSDNVLQGIEGTVDTVLYEESPETGEGDVFGIDLLFTSGALSALCTAQAAQDQGSTWHDAVEEAINE